MANQPWKQKSAFTGQPMPGRDNKSKMRRPPGPGTMGEPAQATPYAQPAMPMQPKPPPGLPPRPTGIPGAQPHAPGTPPPAGMGMMAPKPMQPQAMAPSGPPQGALQQPPPGVGQQQYTAGPVAQPWMPQAPGVVSPLEGGQKVWDIDSGEEKVATGGYIEPYTQGGGWTQEEIDAKAAAEAKEAAGGGGQTTWDEAKALVTGGDYGTTDEEWAAEQASQFADIVKQAAQAAWDLSNQMAASGFGAGGMAYANQAPKRSGRRSSSTSS